MHTDKETAKVPNEMGTGPIFKDIGDKIQVTAVIIAAKLICFTDIAFILFLSKYYA
jgi:hypothetical protein